MPYSEPKRQIFQEFEQAQSQGALPLYACCVGPLYALHRANVESERARIGEYDYAAPSTEVLWPDHVPGGEIDLVGAKILLEDTLLRYYTGVTNAALTVTGGNKILSSLVFKTNAAAPRTPTAFGDRDVQIGDWVRLSWVPISGPSQQILTKVAGFLADVVPGSAVPVEDPFRERGFGISPLTNSAILFPPTVEPTRYTIAYVSTDYNGLEDGWPRDVYTVQVLQVGTGNPGALGGTILRITSEGNDIPTTVELGVDIVYDGGNGWYEIPLGARGGLMRITDAGAGDVLINDTWQVEVQQDYVEVDVANTAEFEAIGNASYTGTKNTKYIIAVITGGTLDPASATAGDVRIFYKTNNGADTQGYLTIPAADFTVPVTVNYPIGIRNVELVFKKGTQFNTGGEFSFAMDAQTEGAIHTLCLQDPVDNVAASDMDMDLLVKTDVEFPADYYTLTQDIIDILGNAAVTSDLLGTPELMSVFGGVLYADYREMRTDNCNRLGLVDSDLGRENDLGPNSPLNPLSKAVYHAITEGEFITAVYYMPICADTPEGYRDAFDALTENDEVYSIVPLSNDPQVHQDLMTHCLDRSSPINNQWRVGWVPNVEPQIVGTYVEDSVGDDLLGTVDIFPVSTYREVNAPGALFLTRDVQPGDKYRTNYSLDIEGNTIYDEFTIDRVNTENQLILVEDLGGPIAVAVKFEIWRVRDNNEYAEALSDAAQAFDTRRINLVWGDTPVEEDGTPSELFYVAAAAAGQRGGLPPHAPQSQLDLITLFFDPTFRFNRTQLNRTAEGGVWIVHKDFNGRIFNRHQITSVNDPDNFIERESSKTTNLDHISRDFLIQTAHLFGQANISEESIDLIRTRLNVAISIISNRVYSAKIGPQMQGAVILRVERDSLFRDTVIVEIDPALPDPLNNLPITFRIS